MSKGQQRSNREKRKPKKERDKDPVKASSVTAAFERPARPNRRPRKRNNRQAQSHRS